MKRNFAETVCYILNVLYELFVSIGMAVTLIALHTGLFFKILSSVTAFTDTKNLIISIILALVFLYGLEICLYIHSQNDEYDY